MDSNKITETVSNTLVTVAAKTSSDAKSVADVASDVIDFTKAAGQGVKEGVTKISQ